MVILFLLLPPALGLWLKFGLKSSYAWHLTVAVLFAEILDACICAGVLFYKNAVAFAWQGFGLVFQLDYTGLLLLFTVSGIFLAMLAAHKPGEGENVPAGTLEKMLLLFFAFFGLVLAQDLWVLSLFLVMIWWLSGTWKWQNQKQLFCLGFSAFLMLSGLILLFVSGESLPFETVSQGGKAALLLYSAGLILQISLIPFCPGRSPLSAIAGHGATAYALFQILPFLEGTLSGVKTAMLLLATFACAASVFCSLKQKEDDGRFFYSALEQISYILMGVVAGNPLALLGAALHFSSAGFSQTLMFLGGKKQKQEGDSADFVELASGGRDHFFAEAARSVALLSGGGAPPFLGFWSKLLIMIGLWQAGYAILAALVMIFAVPAIWRGLSIEGVIQRDGSAVVKTSGLGVGSLLAAFLLGAGLVFPGFLFLLQ